MHFRFLLLFCIFSFFTKKTKAQQPNILLYIIDDAGIDAIPNYPPANAQKANMPHLEALMEDGLTFDNVWVNPVCSPTRASILTGRYGFRTNVLNPTNLSQLDPEEITLHEYMDAATNGAYSSCIIGKWHLSGNGNTVPGYPEYCGIPHYQGLLNGALPSYTAWPLTSSGQTANTNAYATTTFTDMAIDWIKDQDKPWFCWLAHTAPHTPFHLPPVQMHSQGNLPTDADSISSNPFPYYLAMLESTDYELGRLMDSLSPIELENTIIIFLGDNGTLRRVLQSPFANYQGKGSLYQGGIRVPMVIAGAHLLRKNEREAALINGTDLFATIIEMTGISLESIHDSHSFLPLCMQAGNPVRTCAYSEGEATAFRPEGWTIRDAQFKLIHYADGSEELYRLGNDPYEQNNLFDGSLNGIQQAAYDRLHACNPQTTTKTTTPHMPPTLQLFPNPATAFIRIKNSMGLDGTYRIRDAFGRTIQQGRINKSQQIDIEALPIGFYYLQMEGATQGFVKAHP